MWSGSVSGRMIINSICSKKGLSQAKFNFEGDWEISEVTVDGKAASWDHAAGVLTVQLPSGLKKGDKFSVSVSY